MSLVPAYAACATPNRTHGPPLASASCHPPVQTSAEATVGTPDAFGGAANAAGFLRLDTLPCGFNCFDGDFAIRIVLNDVRCVPTGTRCGTVNGAGPADYTGEMRFSSTFDLTDHWNATAPGGGPDAATVQDFSMDLPVMASPWACVQTASTSTGSTCDLNTSMAAQIPGSVKDGKRTILALDNVRILDGGPDGDADTAGDNTVFLRPGVFVP